MVLFAILGVQLFGGKFFSCNDNSVVGKVDCVGVHNYTAGNSTVVVARQWKNSELNFDNFGNAILALMVVTSLDGWERLMWSAIDATDVGQQPVRYNSPENGLYFVVFILIAVFCALNLFIGGG